ncbi:hypothetical protein [Prauserella muralis]|uniref:Uncharacterized protein n=1 Tax=Prauserella muralis TaxID=588067 RepID=A0A2V4AK92_9PSEU|nr:hypothetical protein [Prauserella muralis]PXY20687.1 hypothetical protein BAY60_24435 [Prauserella muralis]TWE29685.1 hypothetical protein FHX69_2372 [Prauserella muralis]
MEASAVSRRFRLVAALLACLVVLVPTTAASATEAGPKGQVKVHAKAEKDVVKAGEKVKIKGKLDVVPGARSDSGGLEPVIVQKLQAGVWVDVSTGWCRPNGGFSLSLSFSLSASLSLRVYHPETHLYASAYSGVFGLVVV